MTNEQIDEIIAMLSELQEDVSVPKNVRIKIDNVMSNLNSDIDLSIKVNKALSNLEEVADDVNMQSYTRTQIWNVISLLEKISH